MEKASKWIRNHLIGKKEDKYKKDKSSSENDTAESPKVKRIWSFGRKTGKVAMHKFSTSFDSTDSANLQVQSFVQTEAPPKSLSTWLLPKVPKYIESAAAIKIQAAFRSYLARKALHALRGVVKIQALVRGHLVRKQTSATLRGMHALMAIQVRARIHRIQTAQEANLLLPKHSSQHPPNKGLLREFKDSKDMDLKEMLEVMESRSGPLDPSDAEHLVMSFYSKHLIDSKQKHQYKGNALITGPSSSGNNLSSSQRHSESWAPNYLTRTESSRAKARSLSGPKQRPKQGTRHKSKSIESTKDLIISLDGRRQSMSSNSSRFIYRGSLDHWGINNYGSLADGRSDSFNSSMVAIDSYY